MKPRTLLLASMVSTSLLVSGAVIAQDQTMQPTATPQNTMQQPTTAQQNSAAQQPSAAAQNSTMQPPAGAPAATTPTSSATYSSSQGQLTVNSKTGNVPSTASPPSFEQLSGGSKMITQEQAQAYPPLANDFIHVAGHSDHITKSQYEHWLQNLN
ncbi:hypothetical protein EKH79_00935 [Dyella dinghuensis]|uniref:DUF4148 domain-containing protein n=1 Tax=Dyella dinghuensis TaxID=1920169 RepID=A0A432LZ24_9GAMM|nr:hypothetical protein [Dyella dinghuensis]RUL67198.1 hypothetical protein EKH79_00935 [Dyella dinghuensis]